MGPRVVVLPTDEQSVLPKIALLCSNNVLGSIFKCWSSEGPKRTYLDANCLSATSADTCFTARRIGKSPSSRRGMSRLLEKVKSCCYLSRLNATYIVTKSTAFNEPAPFIIAGSAIFGEATVSPLPLSDRQILVVCSKSSSSYAASKQEGDSLVSVDF